MRAAAARAASSMYAVVGTAAAAGSGCSAAWPAAVQQGSSGSVSAGSSMACRSGLAQQRRPATSQASRGQSRHGWNTSNSASSGPLGMPRSDAARQRRLVAASAAAEPALAEESWSGWEDTPLQPPPAPQPASTAKPQQLGEPLGHPTGAPHGGQAATQPFQLPVPNLGYTCLNIELQQRFGIRTNRSCRRKTFEAQGLAAVSRLALANCRDLLPLIQWNRQKGIHFFRIPSALFPWSHEYELEQLPDYEEIAAALAAAGAAARAAHQRLTAHPSHFVQLAAQEPALLARSIAHLELNSKVFDLMGYAPSHENKINIHIGTRRGSKAQSLARFAAGVERLSDACRARLTVENDDRPGMYSIADLLPLYNMARTPLVFDYLHHALAPGKLSEEEALLAALATWPPGVRPVVHYSEPSENPALQRRAHSRMLTQPFDLYRREADVDVMLEAKGMEQALLFYRDELQLGRKRESTAVFSGAHRRAAAAAAAAAASTSSGK